MCLIVQCNKDIPVTRAFVEDVLKRNDDGFGAMWVEDNRIHHYKCINPKLDEVMEKIKEIEQYGPYLHFRMRTHGKIDHTNAHPYYCGHGIYVMHNGVLSTSTKSDESLSDTWHFIDQVVKPLFNQARNAHDLLRDIAFTTVIKAYAGYSNRLVFMDRGGAILVNHDSWVQITNEHTGCAGLYVSNSYAWNERSFDPPKQATAYTRNKYSAPVTNHSFHPYSTYVSDKFKDKFEEVVYPYFVDDEWNVWERNGNGFKKCHTISWEDLCLIGKDAEKKTSLMEVMLDNNPQAPAVPSRPKSTVPQDPAQQIPLPLEGEVKKEIEVIEYTKKTAVDLIHQEDEEEDNAQVVDITKEVMMHQAEYEMALVKAWATYQDHEVNTLCYTDPDEASTVLTKLLREYAYNHLSPVSSGV